MIFSLNNDLLATQLRVGVGGWAYLPVKFGNKLQICSKIYDFIEVNSTFYKLPELERVSKWRKSVPETFEFTMRANKELTHEGHLKPIAKNYKLFEQHLEIARDLKASIIHLQFPPSLAITKDIVSDWRDFLSSISINKASSKLKFALEARSQSASDSRDLARLIQDYDIIPTTDASRNDHVYASADSKIVYTRVFGLGEHTKWSFSSQELKELDSKLNSVKARRRYITFHNLTMYEDASRMKKVAKTGKTTNYPRMPQSALIL
jgi:uncharacterized protein YecE (DUF72 family)